MSFYAANGSINVTVVMGTSYTGAYASDGSMNVILAPGGSYVGAYHPCGAHYVTLSPGTLVPIRAPDGSLYVTTTGGMPPTNIGQPITIVSGSFATIPNQTFNLVTEGNSITYGLGGQPAYPFTGLAALPGVSFTMPTVPMPGNQAVAATVTGGGTIAMTNIASSGISAITADQNFSTRAGAFYDNTKNVNILTIALGVNTSGASDTTALQKYTLIRDYIRQWQALNSANRTVVCTLLAHNEDGGSQWNTVNVPLNNFIRTLYNSDLRCDFLCDFGNDPRFSTLAGCSNLTYYTSDLLHPSINGELVMGNSIFVTPLLSAFQGAGAQVVVPTFSTIDIDPNMTLSNVNRTITCAAGFGFATSSFPAKKLGKWYWEIHSDNLTGAGVNATGIANESYLPAQSGMPDNTAFSVSYRSDGGIYIQAVLQATGATWTTGDVIENAVDIPNQLIWFRRNRGGVTQPWNGNGSANPATGVGGISIALFATSGKYLHPVAQLNTTGDQITSNFAASQFQGSGPPAGFLAFA